MSEEKKSPLVLALPITHEVAETITQHFCAGCAQKAEIAGIQSVQALGKLDQGAAHDEYRDFHAQLDRAIEPIINAYAEGKDPQASTTAVVTALLNSQVAIVEQSLKTLHPFARLMWLQGLFRATLLQIAGATEMFAMRVHGIDMQPEKARAFAEGLDEPTPTIAMLELMAPEGFDHATAASRLADSLPEELRDALLSRILGGAKAGVIQLEMDEDSTPEDLAAAVAAQIKAKGGPDLPVDQVAAMIAQGGGVLRIPLDPSDEAANETKH